MRRLLLLPLVSLTVAAGLTACGDTAVPALDVVRTAAATTAGAETARVEVSLDGQVDASATFVGRLDGSELDGTVSMAAFDVPVRVVDSVAYVRPLGDRWLGVDLARFGSQAEQAEVLRGAGVLDALRQVTDVQADGDEQIDGVTTRRYRAVVDVSKVGADLPAGIAGAVRDRVGSEVPVTVWIDADDLVRRVVVEAGGGADRLQVDVTDVGLPVDVEAPPADQVTMLG